MAAKEPTEEEHEFLLTPDTFTTSAPENPPPIRYAEKLHVVYGSAVGVLGEPFKIFSKYVKVFDLYFVATERSSDEKVLHGATVLYQYIDNTNTGTPDNEEIYAKLKENRCTMVMFKNQDEMDDYEDFPDQAAALSIMIQDLEADETRPGSIAPDEFDEALEECFHLVTQGYCLAYPTVFGLMPGSAVSLMMDNARGGYFVEIPEKYPDGAWYTYRDETCDYFCMMIEYIYWAMTSILGGQRFRHDVIKNEWRPYTRALMESTDYPMYGLLTSPFYKLPTRLPEPVANVPLYKAKNLSEAGEGKSKKQKKKKKKKTNMCCCQFFRKYPKKVVEKFLKT